MKYTIETTEEGCVETITLNGRHYSKRHTKTWHGSETKDKDFCEQMEKDGVCEEILSKVYDLFDSFLASDFMDMPDYD